MATPFPTKTSFQPNTTSNVVNSSDDDSDESSTGLDNPLDFGDALNFDEDETDNSENYSDDYNEDESSEELPSGIEEFRQIGKLGKTVGKAFPTSSVIKPPIRTVSQQPVAIRPSGQQVITNR